MNRHYGNFELTSNSKQIADGRWTHEVVVTRHRDAQGVTTERNFSTTATFASKEEADHAAIEFGAQIVDGEYPNLVVHDL